MENNRDSPSATGDEESNTVRSASESKPTSESHERQISALLCDTCKGPVAGYTDILAKKDSTAWAAQVYSYEIDLFETGEVVWSYSATNPSAARFDLIRVNPMAHAAKEGEESMAAVVAAPLTYCRGAYSPEHSFFEGYEWCFCSCLNCGAFLGWGFAHKDRLTCYRQANRERTTTSEKRDVLPSQVTPDFLGIIITKCTGDAEYSADRFYQFVCSSTERDKRRKAVQQLRKRFIAVLHGMKNGVQSHHLYTIFSMAALELYGTIPVDDTWLTEAHTPTPSPSSEDSDSEVSSLSPSEIDAPIRVSTWLVGATLPRLYHAAHSFLRLERQEEKERREAAEREATPATADTAASGEEGDTDRTANDDETPPAE